MKTVEHLHCSEVIPITISKYILTALSLILLSYLIIRARCNAWTSPWFLIGVSLLLGLLFFSAQCGAIKCVSFLGENGFKKHADRSWFIWIVTGSLIGLFIGLLTAIIVKAIYSKK